MNKHSIGGGKYPNISKHILRIMRLTMFLFFFSIMFSHAAKSHSQETTLSLHLKSTTVKDICKEIENLTGLVFVFADNTELDMQKKVDIRVNSQPISNILNDLFLDLGLEYKILDKQVVVYKGAQQNFSSNINEIILEGIDQQPRRTITGNIVDEQGKAIIGANIIELETTDGTLNGTVTDIDGNFSLLVDDDAAIKITYIGYLDLTINTEGKKHFNIILKEDLTELQEVVVTAFATQKRINVTGAISTVSGRELTSTPVANISNALIGNTPGLSGLQTSGEAGRNSTNLIIRGLSTYGNSTPLIVIDGVEQAAEQAFTELNNIDPNEVLGVSVLKDASSTAVYGIRGANGVIIITTKRGSVGKPVINFSANYGITQATMLQKGLPSYDWAYMRNEAIRHDMSSYAGQNGLAAYLFSDDDLWKFKNNRDFTPQEVEAMDYLTGDEKARLNMSPAIYYGSVDAYDQLFGDFGPQEQINLNVSGGTDRIKYFTSFGFFNQKSITKDVNYHEANTKSNYQRYNFRLNFDIDIIKDLTLTLNLAGQFGKMQGPGSEQDPYNFGSRYQRLMHLVVEGSPINSLTFLDGKLVSGLAGERGTAQNPLAMKLADTKGGYSALYHFLTSGSAYIYNTLLDNTIKFSYKMPYLAKGLSLKGTLNYQDNYNKFVRIDASLPIYSVQRNLYNPNELEFFGGATGASYFELWGYSNWNKLYVDAGIHYENSFGNHNILGVLLGKASKYTMPSDENNTASGIVGFLGRLTYNYADRYLAEFNMGYNGTEQFAEGKRFGFFPAFSVGWVPSLEPFFPKNDILTFLKIRASYGEIGNDMLGSGRRYLYLPNTYTMNKPGYWLGNSDGSATNPYYTGLSEDQLGNPNITWEKAKKSDVGLEAMFLNNRLSVVYDWFYESRNNILTTLGIIPAIYGVEAGSVPPANVGETENKGYELVVGWNDKINNLSYRIEGHLSHARNKVIYRAEAPNPYDWMNATGKKIGQHFGLISDGYFNTQEELNNRPFNTFTGNKATLGDIRYKDLNGDGLIDNKDHAAIGYSNLPEYNFGLKLGVGYKGFEASVLFSGARHGSFYLANELVIPYFLSAGNAYQWMYDERWTPEKVASGEKISYPRATYNYSKSDNNFLTSDFWLRPIYFFRLKNIELAYTFNLNKGFMSKIGINSLRIYANGNNVYTFKNSLSNIGIDPETPDNQNKYIFPLIATYNLGFTLQF